MTEVGTELDEVNGIFFSIVKTIRQDLHVNPEVINKSNECEKKISLCTTIKNRFCSMGEGGEW